MPWPVPTPYQLADRAARVYETSPALTGIDARSPDRIATATTRAVAVTTFSLHLHIAYQASELMPTTAIETLDAKASMWGLTRIAGLPATGNAIAGLADPDTAIPAYALLTAPDGTLVRTVASVALTPAGGTVVALQAVQLGAAITVAPNTELTLVSPVTGLAVQSLTTDATGIIDGLDTESDDALRARVLTEVRKGDEDGTVYYERLARSVVGGSAYVVVKPSWLGPGTTAVVLAMAGPRVPTAAELSSVDAAVQAGRSVGVRQVYTLPAVLHPVDVDLQLNPNTLATQAAALTGLQAQFLADAAIGGTIYVSRIDAACSSTSGEYSHERVAPAADVVMGQTEIATLGQVSWA